MQRPVTSPVKIFCMYAHKDDKLYSGIENYLRLFCQREFICTWYEYEFAASTMLQKELKKAESQLAQCQILLILLSPALLEETGSAGDAAQRLLSVCQRQGICVLPVAVDALDLSNTPFEHIDDSMPGYAPLFYRERTRNEAFFAMNVTLRKVLEQCQPLPKRSVTQAGALQTQEQQMAYLQQKLTATIHTAITATDIQDLVGLFSDSPQMLSITGPYLATTGISATTFFKRYRQYQRQQLAKNPCLRELDPVQVLYALSIEQLATPMQELLCTCAYLPTMPLPIALFAIKHHRLHAALYTFANDPIALDEAIEILHTLHFLQRVDQETFVMKPEIQAFVQTSLSAAQQEQWAEQSIHVTNAFFPATPETNQRLSSEQALGLLQNCAQLVNQFSFNFFEAFTLLSRGGEFLYTRGDYEEAEELLQVAYAILEQFYGADDLSMVYPLKKLAALANQQQQHKRAERHLRHALAILEQHHGPNSAEVAQMLMELATYYEQQRQYSRAAAILVHVISIQEQAQPMQQQEMSRSMLALSTLYIREHQYQQAVSLLERSMSLLEQSKDLYIQLWQEIKRTLQYCYHHLQKSTQQFIVRTSDSV